MHVHPPNGVEHVDDLEAVLCHEGNDITKAVSAPIALLNRDLGQHEFRSLQSLFRPLQNLEFMSFCVYFQADLATIF